MSEMRYFGLIGAFIFVGIPLLMSAAVLLNWIGEHITFTLVWTP